VFGEQRADVYERTVGRGDRLRDTSDLCRAGRNGQMHMQRGPCLQLGRGHMREHIGARHLRARCTGLLLRVVGDDLRQWTVRRGGRRGGLLCECGWDDMSFEHESSDLHCRGQRLPDLHHLDLHQRRVQRRGRLGIVLHERWYRWDDLSFEHEPSDLHCRGQRLHLLHHLDLHQRRVQRRGRLGIVLHERLHSRDDMSFEHDPPDLRRRGQRLHHRRHLDLREWVQCAWDDLSIEHESPDLHSRGQRLPHLHHLDLFGVQRYGWHGVVLHERLHHGWGGSVFFEHEPWNMRPRDQWLHRRRKPRSLFDRAGLRALRHCLLGSKLG